MARKGSVLCWPNCRLFETQLRFLSCTTHSLPPSHSQWPFLFLCDLHSLSMSLRFPGQTLGFQSASILSREGLNLLLVDHIVHSATEHTPCETETNNVACTFVSVYVGVHFSHMNMSTQTHPHHLYPLVHCIYLILSMSFGRVLLIL